MYKREISKRVFEAQDISWNFPSGVKSKERSRFPIYSSSSFCSRSDDDLASSSFLVVIQEFFCCKQNPAPDDDNVGSISWVHFDWWSGGHQFKSKQSNREDLNFDGGSFFLKMSLPHLIPCLGSVTKTKQLEDRIDCCCHRSLLSWWQPKR